MIILLLLNTPVSFQPVYTELPVAKEPPPPPPTGKKSKIKKKVTKEFKFSLKYRGEEVEGVGKTTQDAKNNAAEEKQPIKLKFLPKRCYNDFIRPF